MESLASMRNTHPDNRDFFFFDRTPGDIQSFSIGDVWLYFYKETLIAVRDMDAAKVWVLAYKKPELDDGYSHRHEIGPDTYRAITTSIITGEPYQGFSFATVVSAAELTTVAIELASQHIIKHIDSALR